MFVLAIIVVCLTLLFPIQIFTLVAMLLAAIWTILKIIYIPLGIFVLGLLIKEIGRQASKRATK